MDNKLYISHLKSELSLLNNLIKNRDTLAKIQYKWKKYIIEKEIKSLQVKPYRRIIKGILK